MSATNVFITGNSTGLGYGLTEAGRERGWNIYGVSRRGCDLNGVHDVQCDLSDFERVPEALEKLLGGAEQLDLVILGAGVLGEIRSMTDTPLEDVQRVMDINLWANKVVMDWLHAWGRPIGQIVMISSGASVLGNKGWNAYALSKAALNMLARLYSHEFTDTHIAAIAPGLIDSPLMDYLCEVPDPEDFPALQRIRNARGTPAMPGPYEAAERVLEAIPQLKRFESGSYVDIRQILAPEEYEQLIAASKAARRE